MPRPRKSSPRRVAPRRRVLRILAGVLGALAVLSAGTVFALRYVNPPGSSFMWQRAWQAHAAGARDFRVHYRWVDWRHISPYVAVAVIAAEDQRFREHSGFDLQEIRNAAERGLEGGRVRGASTISQQLAKNLFLWPDRSLLRKGLEAWFTVLIETLWDKRRILEVYLNVVEFGDGVYGVEAAARRYFHVSAARLDPHQSALLAAVLPNPRTLRVDRPSDYVLGRAAWIERQAVQLGGVGLLSGL